MMQKGEILLLGTHNDTHLESKFDAEESNVEVNILFYLLLSLKNLLKINFQSS